MLTRNLRAYAHAMIASAAVWDLMGALGALPPWWPPVSYVFAGAGVASACLAILSGLLTSRAAGARRPGTEAEEPGTEAGESFHAAQDTAGHESQTVPVADGQRRRTEGGRRTLGQLLALGIILAAWVLRGDAEIPPDPPLVAASVLGAVLYAAFTIRRR